MSLSPSNVISVTALAAAGGAIYQCTKGLKEIKEDIDALKIAVTDAKASGLSAETSAARAAASFRSLSQSAAISQATAPSQASSIQSSQLSAELVDAAVKNALVPLISTVGKIEAKHSTIEAAVNDIYARLETIEERSHLLVQRNVRNEALLTGVVSALERSGHRVPVSAQSRRALGGGGGTDVETVTKSGGGFRTRSPRTDALPLSAE